METFYISARIGVLWLVLNRDIRQASWDRWELVGSSLERIESVNDMNS